jgi:hypothetical protein
LVSSECAVTAPASSTTRTNIAILKFFPRPEPDGQHSPPEDALPQSAPPAGDGSHGCDWSELSRSAPSKFSSATILVPFQKMRLNPVNPL